MKIGKKEIELKIILFIAILCIPVILIILIILKGE